MKKYLVTLIFSLSLSNIVWANPLLLKCSLNKQRIAINVESLIANGCESKTVKGQNNQFQSRYQVTLCEGKYATGTLEVLSMSGDWVTTHEFSTKNNCYLWREIATNYPCNPSKFGHNGGCDN